MYFLKLKEDLYNKEVNQNRNETFRSFHSYAPYIRYHDLYTILPENCYFIIIILKIMSY